jgi:DHA1 family inner membrane transport protein
MAVVISGFATASALGLPLGTLLGQSVGWRGSFVAVVVLGAVVLVAAIAVVPSVPTAPESLALGQARHAFAPRVLAVLGLCVLIFTAIQSALTYLVPFLDRVTGVDGSDVTLFLLVYGVSTTVGSSAGGRFADVDPARTLVVGTVGVTASLLAMRLFGASAPLVALAVLGVGLFGMGMAPSMQHRVVTLAGPGAPLASSLPASAVNIGIATGSYLGGVAISGAGVEAAVGTGAIVAAIAVATAWATSSLEPGALPATPTDAMTAPIPAEDGALCA